MSKDAEPRLRLGPVVEMSVHPSRELGKVVQSLVEHSMDDLEVDLQVAMNDHVPETSHASEAVWETSETIKKCGRRRFVFR